MKALTALSGLSAFVSSSASLSVTKSAGSSPSFWTNASAITASDDSYATYELPPGETTGALDAVGFGISIPGGSTIIGIEVKFERSKTGSGVVSNTMAQLLKAGSGVGTQNNDGTDWPTTDAVATYGGASSLWGTTWTPSDVNNANFGVQFVMDEGGVNTAILRVDHVQITVWYQ
jgi:large repetitive protein